MVGNRSNVESRHRTPVAMLAAVLLSVTACSGWPMFRQNPMHTGFSPDRSISPEALSSGGLSLDWTGPTGAAVISSPAVADGIVYVGSADGRLYAFNESGGTSCTGVPRSCAPLWQGVTGDIISYSSPAVVDGVVYIASADGRLYAFDAQGNSGCGGSPRMCNPLWTGSIGDQGGFNVFSSPTVVNGVVYVGSNKHMLHAFDASGTTNCGGLPKSCAPLWTGTTGGPTNNSPAVANGKVYVGGGPKLYTFDAAGTTSCSGVPKTCTPLWTAVIGGCCFNSSPVVANNTVYVGSENKSLYTFDASGTTNCSGVPKTCAPLWRAVSTDYIFASPAVADGVLYVASFDGYLRAYDAAGQKNCSGVPKICKRLWRALNGNTNSSPAVANGVIYLGAHDSHTLTAFDTSGQTLWGTTLGGEVDSSPVIANGRVYVGSEDGKLYAFRLPASE